MSIYSKLIIDFYKEVKKNQMIWTIKDDGGFPAPLKPDGNRVMPFWSSKSKVEKVIKNVRAYNNFTSYEISLENFITKWLPDLNKSKILIGINWSGNQAKGFDFEADQITKNLM